MSLTSLERARPKGVTSCPACFSGGKICLYSELWSQFWPTFVWRVSPDSWLKMGILFGFESSDCEVLWAFFFDWGSQVLHLFSNWKSAARLSLVPRFFLKIEGKRSICTEVFKMSNPRCLSGRELLWLLHIWVTLWLLNLVLSCQLLARDEFCNLRERSSLSLGKYL